MASAAAGGTAATSAPRGVSPWVVAPTVGLAAFMEVLDISIANVALQHIAGSLSATPDEATWVLTSYLVTNAIILPMSGWLAATIGRKRYFLGCIIGFSITSLLCGLAPSLWVLILARGLQGITGGGLQPVAQAILADAFPPEKRGQAFAAYGIAVVFAPAIGPTLGGWITDNFDWRWVFLVNVPIGVFLTLLATRVLADSAADVARRKARLAAGVSLDYVGFSLLTIGMGALQIMLDKGQEEDWFASPFITGLAVTATAALAAFIVWELRRSDSIVDLRLLKSPNFAIGSVLMFMLGFILLGSTVLLPLMVQTLFGYTATDAGMVLSPGGFAIMLMMPVVGNLVARVDPRWLIVLGLAVTSLALFHMTNFDLNIDYRTIAWARVFQSIGLAFLFIPINTVAFLGVPPEKSNNASAIINMMRNIGGSFGIALATTLVARRQQYHQSVLVEHVNPFSSQYDATIQAMQQAFAASSATAADALQKAQALLYLTVQKQSTMLSYIDSFWALGVLAAMLVPLCFVMRRPQPQAGVPPAH
jgi:MFS transporter, DHA2 family, multidrug resistance protein